MYSSRLDLNSETIENQNDNASLMAWPMIKNS